MGCPCGWGMGGHITGSSLLSVPDLRRAGTARQRLVAAMSQRPAKLSRAALSISLLRTD